jgi:hypothetical protein
MRGLTEVTHAFIPQKQIIEFEKLPKPFLTSGNFPRENDKL